MTNNKAQKRSISGSQTVGLIFVAVIGLFIARFIVVGYTNKSDYHEVRYNPRAIIDSIMTRYDDPQSELFTKLDSDIANRDTLIAEIRYRKLLARNLTDSAVKAMLADHVLFINKDSFTTEKIIDFDNLRPKDIHHTTEYVRISWDYYINYSLKYRKPINSYHLQCTTNSAASYFRYNLDFLNKYPGFMLWLLLSAIQFALYPVLAIAAFIVSRNFRNRFPSVFEATQNKRRTATYFVLSGLIIFTLAAATLSVFFDPVLLQSGLFCWRLKSILWSGCSLAFIAAIACAAGFMLISGARNTEEQDDIVTDSEIKLLNSMNKLFNNLLLISSVLLCVIVLTIGSLYTSVNTLEIIRKANQDLGYTPFGYQYVLLVATLCSILSFLFFVPAKIRLLAMEQRIKEINPDEKRISQSPDLVAIAKSLFIVGLPIITSIIHFFVSTFANK